MWFHVRTCAYMCARFFIVIKQWTAEWGRTDHKLCSLQQMRQNSLLLFSAEFAWISLARSSFLLSFGRQNYSIRKQFGRSNFSMWNYIFASQVYWIPLVWCDVTISFVRKISTCRTPEVNSWNENKTNPNENQTNNIFGVINLFKKKTMILGDRSSIDFVDFSLGKVNFSTFTSIFDFFKAKFLSMAIKCLNICATSYLRCRKKFDNVW